MKRRGLSEIIGALILIFVMSSMAIGFLKIANRNENNISYMERQLTNKLKEEINSPFLSINLINGTLYMNIYPSRPFKLNKIIIQFYNGSFRSLNEELIISKPTLIPLIKRYSCEKVKVFLIADSGVIYSYSPIKDPRFLSLNSTAKKTVMKTQWISCRLINLLSNPENTSEKASNLENKDPLTSSIMLVADPPEYLLRDNTTLGKVKINLYFDGTVATTYVFMGLTFNGTNYKLGCGSKVTLNYITDGIKLQVGDVCTSSYMAFYVNFLSSIPRTNTFHIYAGNISTSAKMSYNGYYWVPLGRNSMITPLALSDIANFTSLVRGYEKEYYSSSIYRISLKGISKGNFMTTGPLMIFYSSIPYRIRVTMTTNITLYYVTTIEVNNESYRLPINGPIYYKLKPVKFLARNGLTSLAQKFLTSNDNDPLLNVSFGISNVYRTIDIEKSFMPISNASYSIVIPPFKSLPYLTALDLRFNSYEDSTSSYFNYLVNWQLVTENIPTGMGIPYPYLIYINNTEGKRYLVIASRNPNNISIKQISEKFGEYSVLVSGLNVTILTEKNDTFRVYAIKLTDKGSYLESEVDITSSKAIYLGMLTSKKDSLHLNLTKGAYLIILVPENLEKNFLNVIVLVTYVF